MPEEKPWEKYASASENAAKKPWEAYSKTQSNEKYVDAFSSVQNEIYNADKKENQLEGTINDIVKTSLHGISDSEKQMLRDILTNPNTTPEQAKESIQTLQGYHPKQEKNTKTSPGYYVKKDDNGVIRPIPLGQGERPPKEYAVENVWGQTKKDAEDDYYLTDIAKSLFNALPALAKSATDIVNLASLAITGKESEFLNRAANFSESLKLNKNDRGGKSLYNPEGVEEFGDLFSKDRFDLSPKALWNTVNWAVESLPQFLVGAGEVRAGLQGAKLAYNTLRGIKGVSEAGKVVNTASIFGSSFAMNLGENMQAGKEAGLEGRDIAKFAGAVSTVQATIDAFTGLDIGAKLFNPAIKQTEKELVKKFVSEISKDASGKITKDGFKKLGKEFAIEYSSAINDFVKNGIKNTAGEMSQEALQEVTAKAGQQIWDNMSDEDKAKFGTNALSAKSFADYLSNGINSIGVAPVSMFTKDPKKQYEDQSLEAFKIVEGGPDKINETKANLYQAARQGDITEQERDNAIFKIDSYNKYADQMKDFPNMSKKDKKNAFELSFNIEALKKETDFSSEDLAELDPIAIAKIDTKKTLIKGLQKELNHLLLTQDIQKETRAGRDTVNKVVKDAGLETEDGEEMTLDKLNKKLGKMQSESAEEVSTGEEKPNKEDEIDFEVNNLRSTARRPIEKFTTAGWNKMAQTNPTRVKGIVQEALKTKPNNEMDVIVRSGKNRTYTFDIGDNKQVKAAQSKAAGENDFFKYKNLPEKRVHVVDRGGNPVLDEEGEPEFYYEEPVTMKRLDFPSKDRNGNPMNKAVVAVYNKKSGEFISFIREHRVGKSNYTPADQYHLKKIYNSNINDKALMDKYSYKPKEGEIKAQEVVKEKPVQEPVKEYPKTTEVEQKEITPEKTEISQFERESLLEQGYDNAQIEAAVNESNEIRKLSNKELFKKLKSKGIFNLGTSGNLEYRPDLGLTVDEYNATLRHLEAGKTTKTVEKLFNYLDNVRNTGKLNMIGLTGGKSEKFAIPLNQLLLEGGIKERGLTAQEEQEELAKEQAREIAFAETGQFQKQSVKSKDYQRVLERMQKNFPKVKIVLDNTIKGAGQVQGNTIKINPDYAGTDTPIHEAGHILIDAIGYNNKVIQSAIKQLKDTDLWKETKERYPELNEEMLGKEVLAEAIGRNGADIFDKQVDKSKFVAFLEYIFNRLKQLLGLDKNIAISLAKQVIGGIGTKELVGKNEQVQEQRESYADMDLNDLVEEYNQTLISDEKGKTIKLKNLMEKIALRIKEKELRDSGKQLDDEQTTRDINGLNKWFKVLSHFSDAFPEMKGLSKIWNSAFFAKMKEAKEQKRTHDKLAAEVVKDRNKKLGIKEYAGQKLAQLISEQGDKYFGYLDDGKGKLITLDQANQKNLSKAQIDYLRYVREQLKDRALPGEDLYNAEMDVLRTDQGFNEAYRASGLISAIGALIGSNNLSNVKLNFIDPKTGKEEKMDYIDIVNTLSKYSEGGVKEKLDATWQLLKYTRRAIKGRKAKGGEYFLDENGKLNNRFNQPVDTRKAYSKNFYNAMNSYIDETAHIKHISPLVPIVDSLQYMNEKGIINPEGEQLHTQKKELAEWIKTWKNLHIFKQEKDVLTPELTAVLKLLRFMTSAITMWFNVPANIINVALGNYNSWRQENSETWAKGQRRLFGGKKRGGYGTVNKYAADIIDKYSASSSEGDSNPLRTAAQWFTKLAYLGQNLGEFQIQGSGLLGLMSDEDYNSFEYKKNKYGIDELVVKEGVDEKALEQRILTLIDRVSDVQGKYGEKDRRNIMNNELGRALMAYKIWIPDALRTRFGEEGTVTKMFKDGFAELRADIREKGKVKAFWENKAFMSNLKGLMTIGLLMSVTYMDDDDDEKSTASKMFQRALSDVLFVFDPDNLKFTIKRPIAAVGAIEKLIDLGDHLVALGDDDFLKESGKYGDKGDSKIPKDLVGLSPRPIKYAIDAMLEEE